MTGPRARYTRLSVCATERSDHCHVLRGQSVLVGETARGAHRESLSSTTVLVAAVSLLVLSALGCIGEDQIARVSAQDPMTADASQPAVPSGDSPMGPTPDASPSDAATGPSPVPSPGPVTDASAPSAMRMDAGSELANDGGAAANAPEWFDPVEALEEVVVQLPALLDALRSDPDPQRYETNLPARGLISLANQLDESFGLLVIQDWIGVPVFAAGPHGRFAGRLRLRVHGSFGHYDPRFAARVEELATALEEHRDVRDALRPIYDIVEVRITRWQRARRALDLDPEWRETIRNEYQQAINEGRPYDRFNAFRPLMDRYQDQYGSDTHEFYTALGFWIRRDLDGTAESFGRALDAIELAFDWPLRPEY